MAAAALPGNRRLALSVAPDATHILLDVCALPEAVVFNLVHPVRAARGSLGG